MRMSQADKVQAIQSTFHQFADLLTSPMHRELLEKMNDAGSQAAAAGDPGAWVASVQASLSLQRSVWANDRAALLAAVMATGSSGRIVPVEGEDTV